MGAMQRLSPLIATSVAVTDFMIFFLSWFLNKGSSSKKNQAPFEDERHRSKRASTRVVSAQGGRQLLTRQQYNAPVFVGKLGL
jgi:hypothetical protein